ncbi:B-cell scaffold protein with ankyrin repeats [Tiliqua scincoides]|uniref:B-cell scaffold protein with ankyrin repeats n=1 Tax=Tiliqua scincoides TaxID=71010 RepID=UPI003461B83A
MQSETVLLQKVQFKITGKPPEASLVCPEVVRGSVSLQDPLPSDFIHLRLADHPLWGPEDILVIYEEDAEEWALYLKSVLKHIILEDRILLYNLDASSIHPLELESLCSYGCKLVILSGGLLNWLDLKNRYFLDKILQPPEKVVILLCGVENSATLYEMLNIDPSSHVITADQDPEVYLAVITGIIEQGLPDTLSLNLESGLKLEDISVESAEITDTLERPAVLVLPRRISCECPGEIFFLLRDEVPDDSVVVEFVTENQWVTIQPDFWSQKVRCMKALDLPAGFVNVNVYCDGVIKAMAQIEYYTTSGEIERMLQKVTDPIAFACQASKFSSAEQLDSILTWLLKSPVISHDFSDYPEEVLDRNQQINSHLEELPTLLHCAAKFGLKKLATLLLQHPEAIQACKITNKYGENPECIAEKHDHKEIVEIIKELSVNFDRKVKGSEEEEVEPEEDMYVMMMNSESPCNGCLSGPSTGEPPGVCWKIQKEAGMENETEQREKESVEEAKEGKITTHPYHLDSKVKHLSGRAKKVPEETPAVPPRIQLPAMRQDKIFYLSPAWKTQKEKMESREPYEDQKEEGEFEQLKQEDPYTCAQMDDGVYDTILENAFKERSKEGKSFIMNRPPAPAPRPVPTKEKSTPYIAQVFQQKATRIHTTDAKQLYAVRKPVYGDKIMYTTVKPCIPLGQEELVLLQEQVKKGTMSMDEALEKFKQWQNHRSSLEATQQEKIRQLRDSIISKKPEEESTYDKISIVHHPNVSLRRGRDSHGAEGIVYTSPFRKQTLL